MRTAGRAAGLSGRDVADGRGGAEVAPVPPMRGSTAAALVVGVGGGVAPSGDGLSLLWSNAEGGALRDDDVASRPRGVVARECRRARGDEADGAAAAGALAEKLPRRRERVVVVVAVPTESSLVDNRGGGGPDSWPPRRAAAAPLALSDDEDGGSSVVPTRVDGGAGAAPAAFESSAGRMHRCEGDAAASAASASVSAAAVAASASASAAVGRSKRVTPVLGLK